MKKIFLSIVSFLFIYAGMPFTHAVETITCDFYVDFNYSWTESWTSAEPYNTLNEAHTDWGATVGDTVCIKEGTYDITLSERSNIGISEFQPTNSCTTPTSTNTLKVTVDPNATSVTINASGSFGGNDFLRIGNSKCIDFDGQDKLVINGSSTTFNDTNSLVNIYSWGDASTEDVIEWIIFENVTVENTTWRGISFLQHDASTPAYLWIKNNTVHDIDYRAIWWHGNTIYIESNTVYDVAQANYNHAFSTWGWPLAIGTTRHYDTEMYSSNIYVRNNTVHDAWGEWLGVHFLVWWEFTGNTVYDVYSANIYVDTAQDILIDWNHVYRTKSTYDRDSGTKPANWISFATENYSWTTGSSVAIDNIVISNNLISNLGRGFSYFHDTANTSSTNTYHNVSILHNVVAAPTNQVLTFFEVTTAGATVPYGNKFRNNIVENGSNGDYTIYDENGWTFSNNNWIDWVPTHGTITQTDSYTWDAGFIGTDFTPDADPLNYQISTGSINYTSGIWTDVATDFWGTDRDATEPSVGIHEVTYVGDITPPTLTEKTAVETPTTDTTPSYTFNTTESGSITYSWSCSSTTTEATKWDNTITFSELEFWTYSDCKIKVTDAAGNISSALSVTSFTVRGVIMEVTPVTTPTNDNTPSYTFDSTETNVGIEYGWSCSWPSKSTVIWENTITFDELADWTYDDCTIKTYKVIIIYPAAIRKYSNTLAIPSFTIDTTAPELTEVTVIPNPTNDTTPSYTFNTTESGSISYSWDCTSSDTTATEWNNTITFNTLSNGTYSNCKITVIDAVGNVSEVLTVSEFEVNTSDTTAPELTEVTAIPNPTWDSTPNYTFNTTEAWTITYSWSCESTTTEATSWNNTITFNALSDGTYSDCEITVTDAAWNMSEALTVSEFEIDTTWDTTAPTLEEITPVSDPTSDSTPSYTFHTDEAWTIEYSWDCSSLTTEAVEWNNTIIFNELSNGTHTNCLITVTDTAGNVWLLYISDFEVKVESEPIFNTDRVFKQLIWTTCWKTFWDIVWHQFEDSIKKVACADIMSWYKEDASFRPDQNISRLEVTKVLAKSFWFTAEYPTAKQFTDVEKDEWYSKYLYPLSQEWAFWWYKDGTFKPFQNISRAEFVKAALKASAIESKEVLNTQFFDVHPDEWYAKYIVRANKLWIINWYKDWNFRPNDPIKRWEVAKIMTRILELQ